MKKTTLTILIAAVAICSSIYLIKRHHIKTGGFSLSKIKMIAPFHPEHFLEALSLTEQRNLACAFNQDYHYLGQGGQCFAFVSEDDQYVIKFLRQQKKAPPFYSALPLPSFVKERLQQKMDLRKRKQQRDFQSYLLSIQELKEDTGVLFLHLNQTKNLRKTLSISDKAGRGFALNLDDYEFLVQKKTGLIYEKIDDFMKAGQQVRAQALISSIISAVVTRSQAAIIDDDAKIHRNFGCIDEKCLFIDVGRFRRDKQIAEPKEYIQDLHSITKKFKEWLSTTYPELQDYLEQSLQEVEKQHLAPSGSS